MLSLKIYIQDLKKWGGDYEGGPTNFASVKH